MQLKLIGHNRKYELEVMSMLFFPGESIIFGDSGEAGSIKAKSILDEKNGFVKTALSLDGQFGESIVPCSPDDLKDLQFALKASFYHAAAKLTGIKPPWGILTGIRPSKVAAALLETGSEKDAIDTLLNKYFVNKEKAALALECAKKQIEAEKISGKNSVSIYVSIPFCPSRCRYCSFISHSIEKAIKLIPDYLAALKKEIGEKKKIIDKYNLKIETIYIGGGTPTILNEAKLYDLLSELDNAFDFGKIREITVEAGRPDTIDFGKLKILKQFEKQKDQMRISINPQTLNDALLKEIGRNHTVSRFYEAYDLALKSGLTNINVDLIAGLYGDSVDGFLASAKGIIDLKPASITIHTLCIKKSAYYKINGAAQYKAFSAGTEKMIDECGIMLTNSGYSPYYLYKQRNTIGNLENTGYCVSGKECLYNLFMMNEIHSVLGIGAGAVTKLVNAETNQIERIFNFKYPYEYLNSQKNITGADKIYDRYFKEQ